MPSKYQDFSLPALLTLPYRLEIVPAGCVRFCLLPTFLALGSWLLAPNHSLLRRAKHQAQQSWIATSLGIFFIQNMAGHYST